MLTNVWHIQQVWSVRMSDIDILVKLKCLCFFKALSSSSLSICFPTHSLIYKDYEHQQEVSEDTWQYSFGQW